MRTIFAEYNPQCNSIDVYTSAGYMLRIDCWEAEKNLKTTLGSECALTSHISISDSSYHNSPVWGTALYVFHFLYRKSCYMQILH